MAILNRGNWVEIVAIFKSAEASLRRSQVGKALRYVKKLDMWTSGRCSRQRKQPMQGSEVERVWHAKEKA